jgi:hypothetical protein
VFNPAISAKIDWSITMSRVIILCAGLAERWKNYLNRPKQLAPILGQPLLVRTIQQLHQHRLKDIHIVSHDTRLHIPGTNLITPEQSHCTLASLNSTCSLWKRSQIILLGDVCYSDKALKTIIEFDQSLMFFGCPGANPYTGTPHAELFALKFTKSALPRVKQALSIALADASDGGRGKLWELYAVLCGRSLKEVQKTKNIGGVDYTLFTPIIDLTDDIDTPEDYQRLCHILQLLQKSNPVLV